MKCKQCGGDADNHSEAMLIAHGVYLGNGVLEDDGQAERDAEAAEGTYHGVPIDPKATIEQLMKATDPSKDAEDSIVAYGCEDCEVGIECNLYDKDGNLVERKAIEQCPMCQSTNIKPLTKAEYDEMYNDDGSDEFDPNERERKS